MKYTIITRSASTQPTTGAATDLSVIGVTPDCFIHMLTVLNGGVYHSVAIFATVQSSAADCYVRNVNIDQEQMPDEISFSFLTSLSGFSVTQIDVTPESAQGLAAEALCAKVALGVYDFVQKQDHMFQFSYLASRIITVDTVVDDIVTTLNNGTNGLAAIKTAVVGVDTVVDTIDGRLTNATTGLANIKSLIDTMDTVCDACKTLLENGTYGLSAIKTAVSANGTVGTETNGYLENVTYGLNALKTLIDSLSTMLGHGTFGLAAINADTDSIIASLGNATNGLAAIKTAVVNLDVELSGADITAIKEITQGIRTVIDGTTFI